MSDAYTLLEAGSTVTGDTWTMLNNLGGGSGGIGQIVEDLNGTLIDIHTLSGAIESDNILGEVILGDIYEGSLFSDSFMGVITESNLTGSIEAEKNLEGEV